ncbi:hypothetical protein NQZ68_003782 [Dissostichus eleginoides]|nr:hypothetical protein NQZ68_003782 [Dissostichus eleginoides]
MDGVQPQEPLPSQAEPISFFTRVRERERAHKKFRGHHIDGMRLRAPLALPSDVVRPHLKPVVDGASQRLRAGLLGDLFAVRAPDQVWKDSCLPPPHILDLVLDPYTRSGYFCYPVLPPRAVFAEACRRCCGLKVNKGVQASLPFLIGS